MADQAPGGIPEIVEIGSLGASELAALRDLNNDHAAATSFLDRAAWRALLSRASVALGIPGAALLISLDQTASYDNRNFSWFKARFERFLYVDRIIVSAAHQGRGLAARLYEALFARARIAGQCVICCEINLDPPNPGSDAFHERMGFRPIGQASLPNGKTVRYLRKDLA